MSGFWWLVGLFLYIVPWSPGDFDKCLWSKTVHFPRLPESPPTLTPRTNLLLKTPPPISAFLSLDSRSPKYSLFLSCLALPRPHPAPQSSFLERGKGRESREGGREECARRDSPNASKITDTPNLEENRLGERPRKAPFSSPLCPALHLPLPISKWRRISSASASVSGCKTTPAPRSF